VASQARATFEHCSARHTSMQTQRNGTGRLGKPWRLLRASHPAGLFCEPIQICWGLGRGSYPTWKSAGSRCILQR